MNRVAPPGREPRGRWIALLAASVVVHGAVLSTLSAVPRAAPVSELREVEVTFQAVEVPSPVAVVDPVPEEPAPPNIAIPVAPRKASRRPEAPEPTAPVPERSEPTLRPKLVLDAATAARAFFVFQQSSHNGASDVEGDSARAMEAETPDYFEGVGEKQYLSRREPPRLQRHRDGTYRYRGQAFKAIVEKDGSVVFDDGYRQGATVRFDITDAMMRRRGEDPYRVEKKWFLEGTAAFREELLEHHIAKQTFIALRKLRRRLLHISEDGMLSDREKSARVIAIFQDTTDDETGAAARSAIAEFVAERMPATELPLELR